jgi:hypothetical protein
VLLLAGVNPILRESAVNLDSVESFSVGVLVDHLGRLSDDRMGPGRRGSRGRGGLHSLIRLAWPMSKQ